MFRNSFAAGSEGPVAQRRSCSHSDRVRFEICRRKAASLCETIILLAPRAELDRHFFGPGFRMHHLPPMRSETLFANAIRESRIAARLPGPPAGRGRTGRYGL